MKNFWYTLGYLAGAVVFTALVFIIIAVSIMAVVSVYKVLGLVLAI